MKVFSLFILTLAISHSGDNKVVTGLAFRFLVDEVQYECCQYLMQRHVQK